MSLLGEVGLVSICKVRLSRWTIENTGQVQKTVPGHRNGLVQLERVMNGEIFLPTYVLRIDSLCLLLCLLLMSSFIEAC